MKATLYGRRVLRTSISFALLGSLAACVAVPVDPPIAGYTCCNMRSYDGWISSNNVQGGDLIAAGEPAHFDSIKKNYYIYGNISGMDVALRDDNAHSQDETLRWARRVIVQENPRKQLAAWSPEIQKAIRHGLVIVGMTREQVLMSLGYPSLSDTPDLKADNWRYWIAMGDQPIDLQFGPDQKLASISGRPFAVRLIDGAQ